MRQMVQDWIDERFDDVELRDTDDTVWHLGEKISEKSFVLQQFDEEPTMAEAQAVYKCRQTQGSSAGREVIVKARMQVPPEYPASPNPLVRKKFASREVSSPTQQEIESLTFFTERGCSVVPKLLRILPYVQDTGDMPVPGGYLVFVIMEKVPGVSLEDFWDYDFATREKIRAAFRRDLTELFSYNVYVADPRLQNIIYDEQNDKCYFVDHEQTYIMKTERRKACSHSDFFLWGLARHGHDRDIF